MRELRDWLEAELEATRRTTASHRTERRGGGLSDRATHSTLKSIERRLAYLVEARNHRLPEIALLPDQADVRAACDQIRDNVPEIAMEPLR